MREEIPSEEETVLDDVINIQCLDILHKPDFKSFLITKQTEAIC